MDVRRIAKPIAFIVALSGSPAMVDDAGCNALLCLSNLAGATAVAACVPVIDSLIGLIRSGGSPQCDGGPDPGMAISRGKKAAQRWFEYSDSSGRRVRTNS